MIDIPTLAADLDAIPEEYGVPDRLTIDPMVACINPSHVRSEENSLRHISSTCHGVGAALMEKMARGANGSIGRPILVHDQMAGEHLRVGRYLIKVSPVSPILHRVGGDIMLEGTQGTLLSLDHGSWPYVTARNVLAASLLSDVGLSPLAVRHIFGVMRTYPIRVGGPSGPMGHEVDWEALAESAGLPGLVPEKTTVTGKTRRIAEIDLDLLRHAVELNGCTHLLVSFADYIAGRLQQYHGASYKNLLDLTMNWPRVGNKLAAYAAATLVPVAGVSWGPHEGQTLMEIT